MRLSISTIVPVIQVCHIHGCVMAEVPRVIHVLSKSHRWPLTVIRYSALLDDWL